MAFHLSAQDIRLDDGHILRALLSNVDGDWLEAEIDLNEYIGNNDGFLVWQGQGFSESAENISFNIEGDDSVPVLRAGVFDVDGNVQYRDINLAERIGNDNGSFYFVEEEEAPLEEL